MEKVKRTREEARTAFKDFMRRKKERQMQARMELEHYCIGHPFLCSLFQ